MASQSSYATRAAAIGLGGMGLLYVAPLTREGWPSTHLASLSAFAGLAALLVAVTLWRDGCLETRLLALLLGTCNLVAQLLLVTAGPPGGPASPLTTRGAVLLCISMALPILLVRFPVAVFRRQASVVAVVSLGCQSTCSSSKTTTGS